MNHTFAKTQPGDFRARPRHLWVAPDVAPHLGGAPAAVLAALAGRDAGRPIQDRRTSWVRRAGFGGRDAFVKVYDYPTARDRLRGVLRTTALAPSRAARERAALDWLRRHGFAGPQPLAVAEFRRLGLLRRAVLVTEAWPGRDVEALWPELDDATRSRLRAAVLAFAARLHAAGFRDRNLDPRNLLATPAGDGFAVVKIDSPRFRLAAPGRADDRLARADLARLERGLAELDRGTAPPTP